MANYRIRDVGKPQATDVVVEQTINGSTNAFVVTVGGGAVVTCRHRSEAVALALDVGERSGVDVWFRANKHSPALIRRFRHEAARNKGS